MTRVQSKPFTWERLPGSTSGREGTSMGCGQQPSSLPLRAAGACPAGKPGTGESCPAQGWVWGPLGLQCGWQTGLQCPRKEDGAGSWRSGRCAVTWLGRGHTGRGQVETRQPGSAGPSGTPRPGTRWWPRESWVEGTGSGFSWPEEAPRPQSKAIQQTISSI